MATRGFSEDYSTGVEEMDRQHRRIFELMDQLHESLKDGRGAATAELELTLAGLMEYAREHFRDEERLMRRTFYPELQAHIRQHGELVGRLVEHVQAFKRGELPPLKLALFIRDWILQHIVEEDRKYGVHIRTRFKS